MMAHGPVCRGAACGTCSRCAWGCDLEVGDPIERSDTNQALFVHGTQGIATYAIAQKLENTPGARYEYSSLATVILAEIVTRTLTPSRDARVRANVYRDFAQARLFGPAGVTSAALEFDGAGTQIGGSIMRMTLADWGRMGMLLLDGRSDTGRAVVAPAWLAFMKTPSPTNPEYGGQTWLNRRGGVRRSARCSPRPPPRSRRCGGIWDSWSSPIRRDKATAAPSSCASATMPTTRSAPSSPPLAILSRRSSGSASKAPGARDRAGWRIA
ncbi:hypothetical protein AB5I41_05995 [Sphingomonas sp. MMS24-JH45]